MDHEAVPCSPKICGWPLNSSRDHFGLHQGKKLGVATEVEALKKPIFKAYVIQKSRSNGFCGERGKRGSLTAKIRGSW